MSFIKDLFFKQGKYTFDISYITEKGDRPTNEDSLAVKYDGKCLFLSVADGLGAHGGGDIASRIAVDAACKECFETKRLNPSSIIRIFKNINALILTKQTEEIKMKTTLSSVFIRNKSVYTAHSGDTRIYTFKNAKDMFMTADHTVAYNKIMKNNGTLNDIRKSKERHLLTSALGVDNFRPPDISKYRVRPRLSVLICSDGFWEYVSETKIADALRKNENCAHDWLEEMLLIYSENKKEYSDNYTAVSLIINKGHP